MSQAARFAIRSKFHDSIRGRLFVSVVPVILSIAVTTFGIYSFDQWRDSVRERQESVQVLGRAIGRLIARSFTLGDYVQVEDQLSISYPRYIHGVFVRDINNDIIGQWKPSREVNSPGQSIQKSGARVVTLPVSISDSSPDIDLMQRTGGQIEILWSDADLRDQVVRKVLPGLAVLFLIASASLLAMHRAISRSLQPLKESIEGWTNEVSDPVRSELSGPQEILPLLLRIRSLHEELSRRKVNEAVMNVASQVAHDIRSPLAALAMIEKDLRELPEETRLILRSAVGRIQDIANHLLEKNRAVSASGFSKSADDSLKESMTTQLLSSLIEGLLTEKRMQFRSKIGIEIQGQLDSSSYGLFSKIQATEFKRVVSNLVNNSVEAMGETGKVEMSLRSASANQIELRIADNGKGIPPEILSKLGQRGETHGKEGGSGLGIFHARTSVESWGGRLEIQSELGRGTVVLLTLPKAEAPQWFVEELLVDRHSSIAILDDDESIHRIWQGRAESARLEKFGIELLHFSTPAEFRNWVLSEANKDKTVRYLLDYELLGFKETGLNLIEELGIGAQSILVTSRYEESPIRERCSKLKVPLIPKGMAGFVPIRVEEPKQKFDAILIDDDKVIIHSMWKSVASARGLRVALFSKPQEFLSAANGIDRKTPVYVDVSLGQGVSGIDLAQQIHTLGFDHISLSTGYEPDSIPVPSFIRRVVGKEFPEL